MSLNIKVPKVKFSPFNSKIDRKRKLNQGDLVTILDDKGDIIDYAYLINDIYLIQGYPFVTLKLQRTNKTVEMVITDAIQKV